MFTVTGAYGRKYNNANFVREDWENNKDFQIVQGSIYGYINKKDYIKYNKNLDDLVYIDNKLVVKLETGILP